MAKFSTEECLLIIYTELKGNNEANIETYHMPIMYGTRSENKFQLALELHIPNDLKKKIYDLNKNIDLYSKIVIKYGNGTTIKVKG